MCLIFLKLFTRKLTNEMRLKWSSTCCFSNWIKELCFSMNALFLQTSLKFPLWQLQSFLSDVHRQGSRKNCCYSTPCILNREWSFYRTSVGVLSISLYWDCSSPGHEWSPFSHWLGPRSCPRFIGLLISIWHGQPQYSDTTSEGLLWHRCHCPGIAGVVSE